MTQVTHYNEIRIPGRFRDTETIQSHVSRIETEFSLGWAEKHPDLFVAALRDHIDRAGALGLSKQSFDSTRASFLTIVSEVP